MLAFMALQTINRMNRTEREMVSAFVRTVADLEPVAVAELVDVETIQEPEPVQEDKTASATIVRRLLLAQLRTAGKLGSKAPRRESVLTIGPESADLTTCDCESLHKQTIDVADLERNANSVSVSIPDGKLCQMLNKLKADRLKLIVCIDGSDGSAFVRIESDGATFTIPADDANRFETKTLGIDNAGKPCNPVQFQPVRELQQLHCGEFAATFGTVVTAGELKSAIARTEYATDTESTRLALGGILFDQESADRFTVAATDSRRLAVQSISCQTLGEFPEELCDRMPFVVPSSSVRLLSESLDKLQDSESITIAGSACEFCCESSAFAIRGKIVEGRFPRYRDVVPQRGFNVVATFDRKPLQSCIESSAVVCDEESRGMDFHFSNGRLRLNAESSAFGKSETTIGARTSKPGSLGSWDSAQFITFDPLYVLDFLKTSKADCITFKIIDGDKAAILHDTDDDNGFCVVMPLSQDR